MAKTGLQIENDILYLFKNSDISTEITGDVYNYGMRPMASVAEDAEVRFVYGQSRQGDQGGRRQEGEVTVMIYVPDVDLYGDGVMRKDINRCCELEMAMNQWVSSIDPNRSEYEFKLDQTICTDKDSAAGQHCVSAHINYILD